MNLSLSTSTTSRKRFLQSLAVVGAGFAVTPSLARTGGSGDAAPAAPTSLLNEPLVAYVRDPARGEIVIYVGTREVILRDPVLVGRLVRATI